MREENGIRIEESQHAHPDHSGSLWNYDVVRKIDNKYVISLEGSAPYSKVSKAVDVKRMSGNFLNPTLVSVK